MIQKRRRCLFFCPSWTRRLSHCPHHTGQTTPVSPRQHGLYNIRYIETHHADASLSSVCCGFTDLRSSLCTTTDALALASELAVRARKRLSHKIRPPALPLRANKRCCKDMDYFRKKQEKGENLSIPTRLTAILMYCFFCSLSVYFPHPSNTSSFIKSTMD